MRVPGENTHERTVLTNPPMRLGSSAADAPPSQSSSSSVEVPLCGPSPTDTDSPLALLFSTTHTNPRGYMSASEAATAGSTRVREAKDEAASDAALAVAVLAGKRRPAKPKFISRMGAPAGVSARWAAVRSSRTGPSSS